MKKLALQLSSLLKAFILVYCLCAAGSVVAQNQPGLSIKPSTTGYAPANGLKLYYEVYGKGEPLVLLHGGFGTITMFGPVLEALAAKRQVIAVELQGHGHTADIDRPITLEAMGDDVAALLKYLKIEKADIMGYSLGAGTALQTTIRHPEVVRKLVVVSFPHKRSGWFAEVINQAGSMGPASAEMMKQTPMYQAYISTAPKPEDWVKLNTKLGKLLQTDYDWTAGIKAIKSSTLIVVGDADAIHLSSAVEFFGLLGGGQKDGNWDGSGRSNSSLAILPGQTHYQIFIAPALANTVLPFLDEPVRK